LIEIYVELCMYMEGESKSLFLYYCFIVFRGKEKNTCIYYIGNQDLAISAFIAKVFPYFQF